MTSGQFSKASDPFNTRTHLQSRSDWDCFIVSPLPRHPSTFIIDYQCCCIRRFLIKDADSIIHQSTVNQLVQNPMVQSKKDGVFNSPCDDK